jgi:hypothetical protein
MSPVLDADENSPHPATKILPNNIKDIKIVLEWKSIK